MFLYVNTCCKTQRQQGQTSRYLRLLCSNCLALHVKVLSEAIYILCASRRDFDKTMSSSCIGLLQDKEQMDNSTSACAAARLLRYALPRRLQYSECPSTVASLQSRHITPMGRDIIYACMQLQMQMRTATPCQKKKYSEIFNR